MSLSSLPRLPLAAAALCTALALSACGGDNMSPSVELPPTGGTPAPPPVASAERCQGSQADRRHLSQIPLRLG